MMDSFPWGGAGLPLARPPQTPAHGGRYGVLVNPPVPRFPDVPALTTPTASASRSRGQCRLAPRLVDDDAGGGHELLRAGQRLGRLAQVLRLTAVREHVRELDARRQLLEHVALLGAVGA